MRKLAVVLVVLAIAGVSGCGFKDKKAISMKKVLGSQVYMADVKKKLAESFAKTFGYDLEFKSYLSFQSAVNKATRNVTPIP